jgi:hypothetical protein
MSLTMNTSADVLSWLGAHQSGRCARQAYANPLEVLAFAVDDLALLPQGIFCANRLARDRFD